MPGLAVVFPGQGSHAVGMGVDLGLRFPVARRVFDEADEALGVGLSALMRDGPTETLALTENAQPAILTVAVAAWRVLCQARPLQPLATAGHSLGEYAALVAAGVLDFADAVRAVRARGRLMQEAVPVGLGAMAAVVALAPDRIAEILAGISTPEAPVTVAGYNSPDQTTISGARSAVDRATQALTEAGARRVLPLRVSAPFHCPLMRPVEIPFRAVLAPMNLGVFAMPVVTNVEAKPNTDPSRVKHLLVEQLTAPVRWVESVREMQRLDVTCFVELGCGMTLTGLIKKIDATVETTNIEDGATFAAALTHLG
jgi:[acyl-carrier-protein] S-malonyltransferase